MCMPARNAEAWVEEAVDSVLSQTYDNIEIIVVDDGSTDRTFELVSLLSEKNERLTIARSAEPGVIGARRTAYRLAKGTFVANMDADDISLPNRIAAQVEAMSSRRLDLCGTQFDYLFGTERRSPRRRLPLNQVDAGILLFESNPVSNPSVMFRRSSFDASGLPYKANYVPSADYELWSRLLLDPSCRFANLPDVHMLYRVHQGQITRPRVFENRVAAMRVRLNLLDAPDIGLDPDLVRRLCRVQDSGVRSPEPDLRLREARARLSTYVRQTVASSNQETANESLERSQANSAGVNAVTTEEPNG